MTQINQQLILDVTWKLTQTESLRETIAKMSHAEFGELMKAVLAIKDQAKIDNDNATLLKVLREVHDLASDTGCQVLSLAQPTSDKGKDADLLGNNNMKESEESASIQQQSLPSVPTQEPEPELKPEPKKVEETVATSVAEKADSKQDVKASISVSSTFVQKPLTTFQKEFVEAKHDVKRFCKESEIPFSTQDLVSPSFYFVAASLKYLNLVMYLICCCIPKPEIVTFSHSSKAFYLATKLQRLIDRINCCMFGSLHHADDIPTDERLCALFTEKKNKLKIQRRALDKPNRPISKTAYTSNEFYFEHFVALIKFAKRLTQVCRVMVRGFIETHANQECEIIFLKGILKHHSLVAISINNSEITSINTALTLRFESDKKDLSDVLGTLAINANDNDNDDAKDGPINSLALRKQKSAHAVYVYEALWHVLFILKTKGWAIKRDYETISRKLTDIEHNARCIKYKRRNSEGTGYVAEPLKPFWDATTKSFAPICDVLKNPNKPAKFETIYNARMFCLALARYALACTPINNKRSPTVLEWIYNMKLLCETCLKKSDS